MSPLKRTNQNSFLMASCTARCGGVRVGRLFRGGASPALGLVSDAGSGWAGLGVTLCLDTEAPRPAAPSPPSRAQDQEVGQAGRPKRRCGEFVASSRGQPRFKSTPEGGRWEAPTPTRHSVFPFPAQHNPCRPPPSPTAPSIIPCASNVPAPCHLAPRSGADGSTATPAPALPSGEPAPLLHPNRPAHNQNVWPACGYPSLLAQGASGAPGPVCVSRAPGLVWG